MTSHRELRTASIDLLLGGTCVGCSRPGTALCSRCGPVLEGLPFRTSPTPCPQGLSCVVAVAAYDGVARAVLLAHKEEGRLALTKPLGRALAVSVLGVLSQGPRPASVVVHLVPVPSRPRVVRERGHDPLLRISREAGRAVRRSGVAASVDPALRFTRAVVDQSELSSTDRARNLEGAFEVRGRRRLDGVSAVVVDDIMTTGATAAEAVRALGDSGAQVLGVALVAATRRRTSRADL